MEEVEILECSIEDEHLRWTMTRLEQNLNPQKTKIVDMNYEGFDFLEFHYAYEGLEQKVERLNPLIREWKNYFCHGNSTKRFKQLDDYVWVKLWRSAIA